MFYKCIELLYKKDNLWVIIVEQVVWYLINSSINNWLFTPANLKESSKLHGTKLAFHLSTPEKTSIVAVLLPVNEWVLHIQVLNVSVIFKVDLDSWCFKLAHKYWIMLDEQEKTYGWLHLVLKVPLHFLTHGFYLFISLW